MICAELMSQIIVNTISVYSKDMTQPTSRNEIIDSMAQDTDLT